MDIDEMRKDFEIVQKDQLDQTKINLLFELQNERQLNQELRNQLNNIRTARPLDDWHEDIGPVLWWTLPVEEPPYSGSPLDSDWPEYHTHWTPILEPHTINDNNKPSVMKFTEWFKSKRGYEWRPKDQVHFKWVADEFHEYCEEKNLTPDLNWD